MVTADATRRTAQKTRTRRIEDFGIASMKIDWKLEIARIDDSGLGTSQILNPLDRQFLNQFFDDPIPKSSMLLAAI